VAIIRKNVRLKALTGYIQEKLSPYGGGFFCLMCTEMQWRTVFSILSHEALAEWDGLHTKTL
jgi:hypothetical protein